MFSRPVLNSDWFHYLSENQRWYASFQKNKGGYVTEIEAPGFGLEDLEIMIDKYIISIKGNKESRSINRDLFIPEDADASKITTEIENGILRISMPINETRNPEI